MLSLSFVPDLSMISPYTAPASTFAEKAITPETMRWRGAIYFALVPTLFTMFMQAIVIYDESRNRPMDWHLIMFAPLLFCVPLCLLMSGTGYAVAIRCSSRSIGRALLVGCAVGAGWALVIVIAGTTIAQLYLAKPLTLRHVIQMMTIISSIFVPLAVVLCIFTRWRGVRLGFGSSARTS